MNIAKSLAFDMIIETIFPTKSRDFRKIQCDKNDNDEEINHSGNLIESFFFVVVDMTITSFETIFEPRVF
jgi:hypothetical protein